MRKSIAGSTEEADKIEKQIQRLGTNSEKSDQEEFIIDTTHPSVEVAEQNGKYATEFAKYEESPV